jgi:hypothetical protein
LVDDFSASQMSFQWFGMARRSRMRKSFSAVVFLAFCPLLFAQQPPPAPATSAEQQAPPAAAPAASAAQPAPAQPPAPSTLPEAPKALNNDSVVKLVKAGQSDDLIVSTINASPGTYDTTADGLAALKTAGASDKVVAAIMAKASGGATPAIVPIPPSPTPAAGPGAAPVPPDAASQRQLSLCGFGLGGSAQFFVGAGAASAIANGLAVGVAIRYYASISKEVQHTYEAALKESKSFQYVNSEKLVAPEGEKHLSLTDTAQKNKLFACASAVPFWGVPLKMAWNKHLAITTKWEIESPGGCKLKFKTSVTTKETHGTTPYGADPSLKSIYLELSNEDVQQFLEEFPREMEKAGCGK